MKMTSLRYAAFLCAFLIPSSAVWSTPLWADYCASLNGSAWVANASTSGVIHCQYSGKGQVSGVAPNFAITFMATKTAGDDFCPQAVSEQIPFNCKNNLITVNNAVGRINAVFTTQGTLSISGQINILGMSQSVIGNAQQIA